MSNENDHTAGMRREAREPVENRQEEEEPKRNAPTMAARQIMLENMLLAGNATSLTRSAMNAMLNPGKDINFECGYPAWGSITKEMYREMYDREGVGTRVVQILPAESWAMFPEITEDENTNETVFEGEFKDLNKRFNIFQYLTRGDVLSGVGDYGILVIGINDGQSLDQPVEGVNEWTGEKVGNAKHELLYLRPFDESSVTIDKMNGDISSSRFGFPELYTVKIEKSTGQGQMTTTDTVKVHWTRVLHMADNRHSSEVFGVPRMQPVYNRLLDIRKVVAGSGEMFWKGGFPGYSFETLPDEDKTFTDDEVTELKSQIEDYAAGLQRYMTLGGMTVKSLAPQVADPTGHLQGLMQYIAVTLGIPLRIFMGSEQAKLASTQDKETWNKRINKRREDYISPFIIRPFIDRMMMFGILSEAEEYFIMWPDLAAPSDVEKAEVAEKKTTALAKYVAGSVDNLIPPKEYLTMVMDFTDEEADAIEVAANSFEGLEEPEPEPVVPAGQQPG